MNLATLYPDMNLKPALLNTDISLINVIFSIQILKMLSDLLIKSILHVITSYALMTMFQYLVLSLIVVWHIEFLPKLELKHLNVSILQFVTVLRNQSKELQFVQDSSPSAKDLQAEFYPPKLVSISIPKSKLFAQCDKISNVSTRGTFSHDSEIISSDENTKTLADFIPTEEKFKQDVTSTMDLMPETSGSIESNTTSIVQSGGESTYHDNLECGKVCTENIEDIDNGLCQLNKTLQSMEQNLKSLSAKLLHLDNQIVTQINAKEDLDDPGSFSQLSETHDLIKGDLRTSSQMLPSQPLGDQDISDVLIPGNAAKQVGYMEKDELHQASPRLQDLEYLSSIIGKFDGENSRYQAFKYRFCVIADSMSLTDADKGFLLYRSLEDSVTDFLGKVTEEGRISYQRLWTELDSEFDPVLHGMLSHISALFDIESMATCDNLDNLVKLYKFVKLHFIALDRIGAGHEAEGFKMKILSKLRGDVADKISSYMIEKEEKSTVPDILDILRQEILIMEVQQIAENLHRPNQVPNRDDKEPPSSIIPHEDTESHCMFCMVDGHDSSNCKRFPNPKEYHHFLYRHNLCFNCLQYGHRSYDCPQPSQCGLCADRRKHSQVLCSCYHSH